MTLTISFNGQYWCGLIEYVDEDKRWIVREHLFGAEPKVHEVWDFIHQELPKILVKPWLVDVVETEEGNQTRKRRMNPKRRQRLLNRQKNEQAISIKSQRALSLQHEAHKKLAKQTKTKRRGH